MGSNRTATIVVIAGTLVFGMSLLLPYYSVEIVVTFGEESFTHLGIQTYASVGIVGGLACVGWGRYRSHSIWTGMAAFVSGAYATYYPFRVLAGAGTEQVMGSASIYRPGGTYGTTFTAGTVTMTPKIGAYVGLVGGLVMAIGGILLVLDTLGE